MTLTNEISMALSGFQLPFPPSKLFVLLKQAPISDSKEMDNSCVLSKRILLMFFYRILLLFAVSGLTSARIPPVADESDHQALVDFKNVITQDPLQIMSSWNDSTHFCNWLGVTCIPFNGRVMVLNLEGQRLAGSMTPSIGNLTYLTRINLSNNSIYGKIPQELGRLRRLRQLNLSLNSIGGNLPTNLSHCTELRVLNVSANKLVGQIPEQLISLSKLVHLRLGKNSLTGTIPAWVGNFSSLYSLSLTLNNLQGSIPTELGHLTGLGFFQLYGNNLSGTIPTLIYNISSIYYFSVTQNQLHGSLPQDIGLTLPNLKFFAGADNSFTGTIPVSLSNASRLEVLDFSTNGLTGTVPENLASLRGLNILNFHHNMLGYGKVGDLNFLGSLANCTGLNYLNFAYNRFGGELPTSIANLSSQLNSIFMGGNFIYGGIPVGIGNLVNLNSLGLGGNHLDGPIPEVLGKLNNLQGLYLYLNEFSGPIPASIGNLTKLLELRIEGNRLEGSIPPSLGNCKNLLLLNLSSNNLNGTIPKEVIGLSSLSISLVMSHNSLTGELPYEVNHLTNLAELDISGNRLSGEIPASLESCVSLECLYLEDNSFQREIPLSLKTLRGLEELDLSLNNLSGQIPVFFSNLTSLQVLNLSRNDLEWEVPGEGIFANVNAVFIAGNDKLCGGVPKLLLPTCSKKSPSTSLRRLALKVVIPIISIVIFAVVLLCFLFKGSLIKNSRNITSTMFSFKHTQLCISYLELLKSTNGFSIDNLIGSGSFGSVYKGVLPNNGAIVAVKVLNLQQKGASKSFIDECNALRSLRHRNLLKIITACSSIDHQGNDFKSLVYEFMSNGNLDQWLHPEGNEQHESKRLSFINRLNIAIDVAHALEYLHQHGQTPVVHCDVKPSNILLNEDMVAHVGDFGLAKFLVEASDNPSKSRTLSSTLRGSIGYIPPEYGLDGQVSALGDIYSYGILLLEMFTGKRPTDDMFKDDMSIHKFTERFLPENVMDIAEPSMLSDMDISNPSVLSEQTLVVKETDPRFHVGSRVQECLVSMLGIGLSCSATSPHERLPASVVVSKLHATKATFLRPRGQD